MLLRRGIELAFGGQISLAGTTEPLSTVPIGVILAISAILIFILFKFVFFRRSQRFPPSLALVIFGLAAGAMLGPISGIDKFGPSLPSVALPSASDFWIALTRTYFKDGAHRVSPRAIATSMGLANVATGLVGAMPMCHGSGGLTAHYKLGARTGAAGLMIGGILLTIGVFFGHAAPQLLSLIPLSVLGVMLAIVGIYHALLVSDLTTKEQLAVTGTVAVVAITMGNLAFGFGAGILLHHTLRFVQQQYGSGHLRRIFGVNSIRNDALPESISSASN
jgi:MFS superfamily sulfate permease-like transporter